MFFLLWIHVTVAATVVYGSQLGNATRSLHLYSACLSMPLRIHIMTPKNSLFPNIFYNVHVYVNAFKESICFGLLKPCFLLSFTPLLRLCYEH